MELQLRLPGEWPVGHNAWVQTTPPAHIAAGIYDPAGGEDIWTVFHAAGGVWPNGEIARWLVDTARFHYPRARL